jgi:hypothetical protein
LLLAAQEWRANPDTGVVARALLRCDVEASRSDSVESRLRKGADQTIETAAWIEAATPERARASAIVAGDMLRASGLVARPPVLLYLVATFYRSGE